MPFTLRIPNHTSVRTRKGQPVAVATLFRLGVRQSMGRNKARRVWGEPVYLACFRADKEFVVVVSDRPATQALSAYQPRWQTECLVPCVNGRGFDLEATHVTRPERRERRLVLVSSTFCWCDQVGGEQQRLKPITIKRHGRSAMRVFSVGLRYIGHIVLNLQEQSKQWKELLRVLLSLNRPPAWK
jgi:hypothetical protein